MSDEKKQEEDIDTLGMAMKSLKIGEDRDETRSSAQKKKKDDAIVLCAVCLKAYHTKNELRRHIKKNHYADKEKIKQNFFRAQRELKKNPEDKVCQHNYNLALVQVTALEHVFHK